MDTGQTEEGNVNTKSNGERGWIFGHFIDPTSPFHSDDFEIKWSKNPQGASKIAAKANKVAKTVCILVRGKFRVDFPDLNKSVLLEKEGDYVFFGNGIVHSWKALEESLTINIRWPSLEGLCS